MGATLIEPEEAVGKTVKEIKVDRYDRRVVIRFEDDTCLFCATVTEYGETYFVSDRQPVLKEWRSEQLLDDEDMVTFGFATAAEVKKFRGGLRAKQDAEQKARRREMYDKLKAEFDREQGLG